MEYIIKNRFKLKSLSASWDRLLAFLFEGFVLTGFILRRFALRVVLAVIPAFTAHAAPTGFDPIPVQMVYPPITDNGSADRQLASGRVVEARFEMAKPARKPWRIAFLFPHIKDPYWVGCSYGVRTEARRLGVSADILLAGGYDDLIGQFLDMDEAIAAKYDAIVISPLSLSANNASIARASAAGIPVFELANDSTSPDLVTKVTTSLEGMGSVAMNWVIADAQRRGMKSIRVGLLPGPAGAGWVKGEVEGTRKAARQAPIAVHILETLYGDSDRIGQTQLAARMVSKYGRALDYLIGCSGCAPAARLPVEAAGLSGKIRIVAYDLTREIADLIDRGEIDAAADTRGVSQARVAIDTAVNYLEGRTQRMPKAILIEIGLVDRANHDHYRFDESVAPPGYVPVLTDPGGGR